MLYRSKKIYVDKSYTSGRGVFASEDIKAGEILEECHYFIVPNAEYPKILRDHFFSWPKGGGDLAVCLGYGSIFNHSENYCADWVTDVHGDFFKFFATRDIKAGEEIFTNYQKEVDF